MSELLDYLSRGGVVLWLIVADALLLYGLLAERLASLWHPATWQRQRAVELQRLLQHHQRLGDEAALISLAEQPELTRHLAVIRALVAVAPLLGLLGTVGGIITTFERILLGDPGAGFGGGIAAALVTTQLGIAVAVPGLLLERLISRRAERLAAQSLHAGARRRAEVEA